ncbi:CG2147, partial [Drosophila busckii]
FLGSLTPGWNDPPPVATGASSSVQRPRLDLRKRVAYPMDGNNFNATASMPQQPFPQAPPS